LRPTIQRRAYAPDTKPSTQSPGPPIPPFSCSFFFVPYQTFFPLLPISEHADLPATERISLIATPPPFPTRPPQGFSLKQPSPPPTEIPLVPPSPSPTPPGVSKTGGVRCHVYSNRGSQLSPFWGDPPFFFSPDVRGTLVRGSF